MLNKIKLAIRKTGTSELDIDILSNIKAALLDMARVGIKVEALNPNKAEDFDELQIKCCEFYCKWIYDYLGKGESWQKAYENLRDAMSISGKYGGANE